MIVISIQLDILKNMAMINIKMGMDGLAVNSMVKKELMFICCMKLVGFVRGSSLPSISVIAIRNYFRSLIRFQH